LSPAAAPALGSLRVYFLSGGPATQGIFKQETRGKIMFENPIGHHANGNGDHANENGFIRVTG
jgi:hypothetical protein